MPSSPASNPTYILSINTGSSSVKFSLFTIDPAKRRTHPPTLILESSVSKLTSPPAVFKYIHKIPSSSSSSSSNNNDIHDQEIPRDKSDSNLTHDDAFQHFLKHLQNDDSLDIGDQGGNIKFTCHRIVHGGDFPRAVTIDDKTYQYIDQLTDLAPLHNAPALSIVQSTSTHLPKTHNIAYFDTAFHTTMPDHIKTYPINLELAAQRKIRKYGFHGISYGFITRSVAEFLKKPIDELNIIALHLGSGASVCAIKNGKSYDNSMGLTPLEGLPGATRSGTVDPSLVFHYTSNAGKLSQSSTSELHISKAEEILNKQSGWSALTGTSDFSTILTRALSCLPSSTTSTSTSLLHLPLTSLSSPPSDLTSLLALQILLDRILTYLGSYHLKLQGHIDALVFAGGIGEKSGVLRRLVVREMEVLGYSILEDGGEQVVEGMEGREGDGGPVVDVTGSSAGAGSSGKTGPRTLVCQTDEQFEMARDLAQEDGYWMESQ